MKSYKLTRIIIFRFFEERTRQLEDELGWTHANPGDCRIPRKGNWDSKGTAKAKITSKK
jgi:hypothetical protein